MKSFKEFIQTKLNESPSASRLFAVQQARRKSRAEERQQILLRVFNGLKTGLGTDREGLEGVSFTGEMLRSPLPGTGDPHQGQGANLDDETIKAARALGILVPGEHGHLKLVAAEDWRVRGSNYERPFGGEDDHLSNDPDDWHNDAPPYGRPHDLRTPSGISVKDGTDTFGRRRRYPYGFDGYDAAEDRSRAERDRTQGHK